MDKDKAINLLKNIWLSDEDDQWAIHLAIKAMSAPEPTPEDKFKEAILLLFEWHPGQKWMTVDANGSVAQHEDKPLGLTKEWMKNRQSIFIGKISHLPAAIDWRVCIIENTSLRR